jgi:hypothetical protein
MQLVYAHRSCVGRHAFVQVSRFSTEFMKRKLMAVAGVGKKTKKAKAKAPASVPAGSLNVAQRQSRPAGAAAGPSVPAGRPAAAAFPALGAAASAEASKGDSTAWAKVPKTAPNKKKSKGKKVDSQLLGFATGTNYSLLETPE